MLRHAGVLRPALRSPGRVVSRNQTAFSAAPWPCSRHTLRPTPNLLRYDLHHHARRRRDGGAIPPIPRAYRWSGPFGMGWAWESGLSAAVAGAQRMTFSGVERGAGRAKKHKEQQASSTMDEETRRSIGKGDEKAKKSMQTVKVRGGNAQRECLCSNSSPHQATALAAADRYTANVPPIGGTSCSLPWPGLRVPCSRGVCLRYLICAPSLPGVHDLRHTRFIHCR